VREANVTLEKWRAKGYGIALWRDNAADVPLSCDLLLTGQYPGYAPAVNALAREVLTHDPSCTWVVIGGDDTEPDPHDPNTIATECESYFGGTFGVMQPTGDRFADGSIDRIAGSPWIGREWCERANGGAGPLWYEFTHMFVDQCLQETATRCGVFWQRRDLIHLHRHFMRESGSLTSRAVTRQPPKHLQRWNTQQHWKEMLLIYERLRRADFAPCMPKVVA
jgi:hypothetical protein